jgi:hypothetical protein
MAWREVSQDGRWWWDGARWQPVPVLSEPTRAQHQMAAQPERAGGEASSASPATQLRRLRLRYAGTCILCGAHLEQGSFALHHKATMTVRCIECPKAPGARTIDGGAAGASAYREYERRKAAREERAKLFLGKTLGSIAVAASAEDPATVAWKRGAIGESKLAAALAEVPQVRALHDRRVRGTRGNIDHIVVGPTGVFVIDAKLYRGVIRVRDRGTLFKTDERLYVGSRDCSRLAENMAWQVAAIKAVLASVGVAYSSVPVQPVLCFVDSEWAFFTPSSYKGVRLEGLRSIKKLLTSREALNPLAVGAITGILSSAFPPK